MLSGFKILSIDNFSLRSIREEALLYEKIYLHENELQLIKTTPFKEHQWSQVSFIIDEITELVNSGVIELIKLTKEELITDNDFSGIGYAKIDDLYSDYKGVCKHVGEYGRNPFCIFTEGCDCQDVRYRSKTCKCSCCTPNPEFLLEDFGREEIVLAQNISTRVGSLLLSKRFATNITPILTQSIGHMSLQSGADVQKNTSLRIMLKKFPTISKEVPICELIAFISDKETRYRHLILKQFLTKLAEGSLSDSEITDTIDYLLLEYERAYKINNIKFNKTSLEAIIVPTLEFIENLCKLKLSRAAQAFFTASKAKIDFFNAELNFKGREVSYLHLLNNKFHKE